MLKRWSVEYKQMEICLNIDKLPAFYDQLLCFENNMTVKFCFILVEYVFICRKSCLPVP